MKRRDFLKTAGAASAWPGTADAQGPNAAASNRDAWIAIVRRLADPVLTNLANGTLKARMPVEQAAGTDRRSVTHLEALGRLIAVLAWLCIRGGIPPAFITRNADGQVVTYLLVDGEGRALTGEALERIIPYVADPVEVGGVSRERGGQKFLTIDADRVKRL